jgi:quercetin dioxygenase-like cupin family protein
MFFGNEKERQREAVIEGVTRGLLCTGERIQVFQLEMKGGKVVPEHFHPNEQAGYIVKGKFEAVIGDEKGMLEEGSYFRIPANVPHSGFVHEDTILLDIYSPPRT